MRLKSFIHIFRPIYLPLRRMRRVIRSHKWVKRIEEFRNYYEDQESLRVLALRKKYIQNYDYLELCRDINMVKKEPYRFLWDLKEGDIPVLVKESHMFQYEKEVLENSVLKDKYIVSTSSELGLYAKDSYRIIISNGFILSDEIMSIVDNNVVKPKYFSLVGIYGHQYFDVFSARKNEVVIDAGAFDGTTESEIMSWGGENISQIIAFELDPENAKKCEKYYKENNLDKVTIINKGVGSREEEVFLDAEIEGSASSRYGRGGKKAYITAIDDVVGAIQEDITFIKMDVEGSELEALKGAQNTIKKYKPHLAICVYHKDSDLYEIPKYILSLVSEYRFVLRHYTSCEWETVLYASIDGFQIDLKTTLDLSFM